ncbi:MAG: 30S ribosomal protein S6e [Candidatus Aenigmarchaeota archaeon]|nr:30S ribosomal protein S6e [Candidatus Aenigmarchaeota archaeon]
MANFKITLSEPETRKSYQIELDQDKGISLVGKKIGDEFSGDMMGLSGYSFKITGGTDKDGFPMHHDVSGSVKKKIILSQAPAYHPLKRGNQKRKTIRGNTISQDITQINAKVTKKGSASLEEMYGKKEAREESPKE